MAQLPTSTAEEDTSKALLELVQSKSANHFYFNGFVVGVSASDVTLVFKLNDGISYSSNCSFTIAKTLGEKLTAAIKQFEEMAGQTILTSDDIVKLQKKTNA